jgi:hypothetical protein
MLNTFYLIVASKGGVKGERSQGRKVVASVMTKNQRLFAKAKKMTKLKNKPTPTHGWCRSGVPKIATPAKGVDPEKTEEVWL